MHGCRALTLPWYQSNTITNRNPMVVRPMTSRDLKGELVTSILRALRANISKTAGNRLRSKGPPIGNGLWGIQWSHDQ